MKKGTFIGILFLGIISAFFALLGPAHEIWHWLTASIYGIKATMGWTVTYMDLTNINLTIAFSGMFGEAISLTVIFMVLFNKGYFKLSAYFLGYMSSFIIVILSVPAGFVPVDIEAAMGIAPEYLVNTLYYVWVVFYFLLLVLQIGTIVGNNRVFFGKKGEILSKKAKTSNNLLTTT